MSIFSLNILRSNRAGGFDLTFFPIQNALQMLLAISQGNTSRRKIQRTGSGRHPRAVLVWESGKPLIIPVGFQKAVGMRKERSQSCCVRQRWNQERRQVWAGEWLYGSVPLEERDNRYSEDSSTRSAGLALKRGPPSQSRVLFFLFFFLKQRSEFLIFCKG